MNINSAGSTNINLLQSDQFTFRNEDYVVSQGGAFSRSADLGAVAAQYSKAQLWNPSGSGVTLILDNIYVMSDTAGVIALSVSTTTLGAGGVTGQNNLVGGGTSGGRLQTLIDASAFLSSGTRLPCQAGVPVLSPFKYPFIMEEDQGIFIRPGVVNASLVAAFFWREV